MRPSHALVTYEVLMLKLYGFSRVNPIARGNTRDLRVLWALEEMQIPFEIVGLDHPKKELSTDAYRKLNPLEQIPTIDDDGIVLAESGAILIYLAKKSGKLMPSDAAGEAQVTRWSIAALNSIEFPLLNIQIIDLFGIGKDQKETRDFMVQWANRHLGNLERWLDGRTYVAADSFTIADILMSHVLTEVTDDTFFQPFPRVLAYRQRCMARPAWKKTIESYCERVVAG
jgi:glutathione S-transferase